MKCLTFSSVSVSKNELLPLEDWIHGVCLSLNYQMTLHAEMTEETGTVVKSQQKSFMMTEKFFILCSLKSFMKAKLPLILIAEINLTTDLSMIFLTRPCLTT